MKLFKIIKKEYLGIVKKKSFVISTLLTPFIMGAFIFLPILITQVSPEFQKQIAVIDLSNQIFPELVNNLNKKLKNGELAYKLIKIKAERHNLENIKNLLKGQVEKEKYYAYLIIQEDIMSSREVEYYAKNVSDVVTIEEIKNAISDSISGIILQEQGLELEKIKEVMKKVELKTIKIVKGKEKKAGFFSEYMGLIFLVALLFGLILGYGQVIMRGVLEEKNSRIIEVLLSSTDSFHLMMGKILGIGAAGLTQMLIWSLLGASSFLYVSSIMPEAEIGAFGVNTIIFFVIFFLLGFFLFATLFAAVGAVTNSDHEAQQLAAPITYILIIPFILAFLTAQNPNGLISTILSFVPFFTPTVMFMRINITSPPLYQILASILLLIITIMFIIWVTAKIFRVGILMYGKRPSLKEIVKWIKYR